jgi:MoaA/NifB/PqqE/SkfB family radical SAM enzyme
MKLENALSVFKSIAFANLLNEKVPANVMWRITNRCNSQCEYCGISTRKQKELSTAQIMSLIDQMAAAGAQRIGFVGGEALLREDFADVLDYVKSKDIYVTLVSNGYLIPQKIDIAKRLDCLVLSFDGRKENHERNREKGAFDKVMKAIKAARKNGINLLSNTVLTKYNLDDIDFVLDTAKKYGFYCTFNLVQFAPDIVPKDKDYREAIRKLIREKKKGAPIVLSYRTLNFLLEWTDFKKFVSEKKVTGFRCLAGKLICNIDTDGRIAPCDILSHVNKTLNPSCVELGFAKAFHTMQEPPCKACTCTHVIEYNYMFSFHLDVIWDWLKVVK